MVIPNIDELPKSLKTNGWDGFFEIFLFVDPAALPT